jgi:fumarylacetoacetate (FAA) hydrolase family protein
VIATGRRHAEVVGYLVCDDKSSRSIEGENALYLPQAKMYAGSCALSSGIRPAWELPAPNALEIVLTIEVSCCLPAPASSRKWASCFKRGTKLPFGSRM